ncbi:hypothetical protein ACB092_12G078900 [Castanea dentata]
MAATSCARAAISAVGKVPSQILDFLLGSRTSETHFCEFFFLTPRYTGCLVSLNFFLPSRFLGFLEANMSSSSDKFTVLELPLSNSEDLISYCARLCGAEECLIRFMSKTKLNLKSA